MTAVEVNFDGLVGPTHNYGGLSFGNVASMASGGEVSNPQEAALQGLGKMRKLRALGLPQGVLPPHERPHADRLRRFGFIGSDADVIEAAGAADAMLLRQHASAAAMWTANAATVSPSADTRDARVHFTPANLGAMAHRAIEPDFTGRVLERYFPEGDHFSHHDPIPFGGAMGDEGAANHGRLCARHDAPGIELFTFGRQAYERLHDWRFPPRQAREASEGIARLHHVRDAVYLRQSKEAIEAGAFHNDVVGVANGPVLLYHERAYEGEQDAFDQVRARAEALGFEPHFLMVSNDDVPLDDAIRSYLFNSQLVSLPGGGMALILPGEAETTGTTKAWVDAAVSGNGPITDAHFMDLHQSMKNGGGPACLRLRVVLNPAEWEATHGPALLDEGRIEVLEDWVRRHYRDRLSPEDLADPNLLREVHAALDELTDILDLGNIYDFQR